jgi:hypothetical protein
MNSILYITSFILIVLWAIGFFLFALGNFMYLILVIGVAALFAGLIRRPTVV